jgi:hypothetical protein
MEETMPDSEVASQSNGTPPKERAEWERPAVRRLVASEAQAQAGQHKEGDRDHRS